MPTLIVVFVLSQFDAGLPHQHDAPHLISLDSSTNPAPTLQIVDRQVAPRPPGEPTPLKSVATDAPPVVPSVPMVHVVPVTQPSSGYESTGCTSNGCHNQFCSEADGFCPNCPLGGPVCWDCIGKEDGCLCKLHGLGDMYPHFAYYPKYHGHYYFRPYNYQNIAEHQRFAQCIGLDPRMPYSLTGFERIYAGFPEKYPPNRAPIGTAMPQGSGLPMLEDVLTKAAETPTALPPTPPMPQE